MKKKERDIVDVLASFATRQQLAEVPDRTKALAKIHIVDCCGVMLAGAAAPQARMVARLFHLENVGVDLFTNQQNPNTSLAAFLYTFWARVLEYDDVQTTETSTFGLLTNPTAPVLAATLAVGSRQNATGTELLNAYLAGVEIATQLAENVDPKALARGLPATAHFGAVGALIAAARLLGLQRKAIRIALTIWETAAARGRSIAETPFTSALRDAQSVRAATEAALLAHEGTAIEVPETFSVFSTISVASLGKKLGKPYRIHDPGFAIRTYACNALSHPALDLMLALVNLNDLAPQDIDRVDVEVTEVMGQVLSLSAPTGATDLRRNLPFGIALAAFKGAIVTEDFNRLPKNKALHDFMDRVHCKVNPELSFLGFERARTSVRATLVNGRVIQMKSDVAKGAPQKPLSEIELSHKFLQCALGSIEQSQAERLLNQLWSLEMSSDVSSIFRIETTPLPEAWRTTDEHAQDMAD